MSMMTTGPEPAAAPQRARRREGRRPHRMEIEMTVLKTLVAATLATLVAATALPASAAITYQQREPHTKKASNPTCGKYMLDFDRVYPQQILGIESRKQVWVIDVCHDEELGIGRNEGNGAVLRRAIAANPVLVKALGMESFFPIDVIAVKMLGDEAIQLYVHRYR